MRVRKCLIAFLFPIPFRIDSWLPAKSSLCSLFDSIRPREGTRPAYSYTHHSRGFHSGSPSSYTTHSFFSRFHASWRILNLIVWPERKHQPILLERPASSIVGSGDTHHRPICPTRRAPPKPLPGITGLLQRKDAVEPFAKHSSLFPETEPQPRSIFPTSVGVQRAAETCGLPVCANRPEPDTRISRA
ncbi:hypothetical protein HDV57DRAFT_373673 [Trichoderma longibrachiatum]|uniref:Uncharacterized protein n=1 Tax=Trichoderma longibrachiatum ATCC 18648 TaxID=983965 RepID=A0A2T4BQ82_TRILO|nr:hypothetical protein M440DRAFT_214287 [Trichoderma longibrachiatum ATCC 18648]